MGMLFIMAISSIMESNRPNSYGLSQETFVKITKEELPILTKGVNLFFQNQKSLANMHGHNWHKK